MDTNEDEARSSFEMFQKVSKEQMEKWKKLIAECDRRDEIINLVPINDEGEAYIKNRYPIAALHTRSEIQRIAQGNFATNLAEDEIQGVTSAFLDDYPFEIHVAIVNAVESVLELREETRTLTKEGNEDHVES